MLVGDQDGVVVVARANLERVVEALAEIRAKEEKMEKLVASGAKLPPGMEQMIAEKGVRFVD